MRMPWLVLSCLLISCGPSFQAATPAGFVELDEQDSGYDYRATTADGLVLAVREIEHDPKGDIDFWVRAIENELRTRGGYALIDNQPIKNAQGMQGRRLRFGHDEGNRPHVYTLSVFVTDDYIYILEAGGSKELADKHAQELEWAVQNFRID